LATFCSFFDAQERIGRFLNSPASSSGLQSFRIQRLEQKAAKIAKA